MRRLSRTVDAGVLRGDGFSEAGMCPYRCCLVGTEDLLSFPFAARASAHGLSVCLLGVRAL